ncbi:FAD-dependent oxidoreductase [Cohnella fermenti]|nr:FAD-dependent oxidoreductase [Cohnella fermenti]
MERTMQTIQTDVLIAGAGSGGFGAAIRLARANPDLSITVVEAMNRFGGSSTVGGVNCWEPGVGGPGIHYELYERLAREAAKIGIGKSEHAPTAAEPYGLSLIEPDGSYERTLRRSALDGAEWRRVHFEPDAMGAMMETMLRESGNVAILYGTRLTDAVRDGRVIQSVRAVHLRTGETTEYRARYYIDCTGGVHLARMAGCRTAYGEESKEAYREPSAPASASRVVNGVTLLYRLTKREAPAAAQPEPQADEEARSWMERMRPVAAIGAYPNGDWNVNVLPVMQGQEFHSLSYEEAMDICRRRIGAHWQKLRKLDFFADYRLRETFPLAGIRESHRLVGRHVLREQDVRAGFLRQDRREELIAYADHALDTHGESHIDGPNLKELAMPYGVPLDCLLPQELDNLIVATRGASFTHIAAASCRLSRTMMALGEAAGIATAIAVEAGTGYSAADAGLIRERLQLPAFEEKLKREWGLV